jgi:transcription initiation factor TFIIIB Brf1 subunit/transcription initiation factor TFIIB
MASNISIEYTNLNRDIWDLFKEYEDMSEFNELDDTSERLSDTICEETICEETISEETISEETISEETINDSDECVNCKAKNSLIQDMKEGFVVCNNCGIVCDELLDCNPEWKNYDDGNITNGRCGVATNFFYPKSSLGTTIAGSNYNRIKRSHNWGTMPYRERSLYLVLDEITVRCEKYYIKKIIIDDSKFLYKKISECKHLTGKNNGKFIIFRGSNRRSLIAACVFFACKLNKNTRSPKEIAQIFNLKMTEITKGCKKFLQLMKNYDDTYRLESSTPEHFIIRYCNILQIHKKDIEIAQIISQNVKKLGLASDHTPPSVAAGSILLMSKMNNLSLTKKSISKKFSISEVTISKIYKKIEEYQQLLVDTEQTDKIVEMMNQM